MQTLKSLTIRSFHEGLLSKRFSTLEIAQAFFNHIKETDGFDELTTGPKIGAYLSLAEEEALKQAEAVDLSLAKGEEVGQLAGVPLAIKDNILIKGQPATAGSKILENYIASYDAGVIQKLKEEKAVFLGKTNMDEFAMGSSTENSAFGPTRNPHDLERVAGGSSGGSAAAVAAHMTLAALGSDTGGSVRQPAAFCGVVGLNPTYGTVSRSGLIAMASSLDQIGPITKTVEDAAIIFGAIAGKDPMDSTNSPQIGAAPNEELLDPKLENVRGLTIGLPKEYFAGNLAPEVEKGVSSAIEKIKGLGLAFKEVSLPHTKYGLSVYYIIVPAEVSANLAKFDGIRYSRNTRHITRNTKLQEIYFKQRGGGFGVEVKRRIILGTFVLSSGYYDAYYEKAQRVRALIRRDFEEVFKGVDVLLAPTTPTPAFKIEEKTSDPISMYLADVFTIPTKLAGLPAVSIPVENSATGNWQLATGLPDARCQKPEARLPVGFQLIGKPFREVDILGLGQYYEKLK